MHFEKVATSLLDNWSFLEYIFCIPVQMYLALAEQDLDVKLL